jgi:hypothetical protein
VVSSSYAGGPPYEGGAWRSRRPGVEGSIATVSRATVMCQAMGSVLVLCEQVEQWGVSKFKKTMNERDTVVY